MNRLFNILNAAVRKLYPKKFSHYQQESNKRIIFVSIFLLMKMRMTLLIVSFIVNQMVGAETWKLQHSNEL